MNIKWEYIYVYFTKWRRNRSFLLISSIHAAINFINEKKGNLKYFTEIFTISIANDFLKNDSECCNESYHKIVFLYGQRNVQQIVHIAEPQPQWKEEKKMQISPERLP